MGTRDSGTGSQPVMAKWCQKWPHLCQFEIKDQFIVWTAAVNVLSYLPHLHIYWAPLGALLFFYVKCVTAHMRIYVTGGSSAYSTCLQSNGIHRAAFRSHISFSSQCLSARALCYSVPCYFASLPRSLIRPFAGCVPLSVVICVRYQSELIGFC